MSVQEIRARLRKLGDKERAKNSQWFFKTGPGEYGEGDRFLGIKVPELRKLAKEYQAIPLTETTQLLQSPIHEERLLALLILVRAFANGDERFKEIIYHLYLDNTQYITPLCPCQIKQFVGAAYRHHSNFLFYQRRRAN
jgi:hypothetical protein